jgi:glyceraldehyde 3-phosphate dehydrogenase
MLLDAGPQGNLAMAAPCREHHPHSTGAAKRSVWCFRAGWKASGHAQRVPVKDGSVTELVCELKAKNVTVDMINDV